MNTSYEIIKLKFSLVLKSTFFNSYLSLANKFSTGENSGVLDGVNSNLIFSY